MSSIEFCSNAPPELYRSCIITIDTGNHCHPSMIHPWICIFEPSSPYYPQLWHPVPSAPHLSCRFSFQCMLYYKVAFESLLCGELWKPWFTKTLCYSLCTLFLFQEYNDHTTSNIAVCQQTWYSQKLAMRSYFSPIFQLSRVCITAFACTFRPLCIGIYIIHSRCRTPLFYIPAFVQLWTDKCSPSRLSLRLRGIFISVRFNSSFLSFLGIINELTDLKHTHFT